MVKRFMASIILLALFAALLPTRFAYAEPVGIGKAEALTYLGQELEASSDYLMTEGEDSDGIYTALNSTSLADTFPARFDLRERGTVTSVKNQSPWGTCWSFATVAANERGAEAYNAQHEGDAEHTVYRYTKGVVNPGESFVSFAYGEWLDWSEAIAYFGSMGSNVYMAYDNLPIKAYLYPWSSVEQAHDLSHRVPALGGEVAICPEDGYTLLDPGEK